MIMGSSFTFEFKRLAVVLISILMIGGSMFILSSSISGDEDTRDPGPRSSDGEIIERDFDVQFMIEPSDDPLDPHYGEKWAQISPGQQGRYWVIVSNIGTYNDTYNVTLSGLSRDSGWDCRFMDTGLTYTQVNLTSPHHISLI